MKNKPSNATIIKELPCSKPNTKIYLYGQSGNPFYKKQPDTKLRTNSVPQNNQQISVVNQLADLIYQKIRSSQSSQLQSERKIDQNSILADLIKRTQSQKHSPSSQLAISQQRENKLQNKFPTPNNQFQNSVSLLKSQELLKSKQEQQTQKQRNNSPQQQYSQYRQPEMVRVISPPKNNIYQEQEIQISQALPQESEAIVCINILEQQLQKLSMMQNVNKNKKMLNLVDELKIKIIKAKQLQNQQPGNYYEEVCEIQPQLKIKQKVSHKNKKNYENEQQFIQQTYQQLPYEQQIQNLDYQNQSLLQKSQEAPNVDIETSFNDNVQTQNIKRGGKPDYKEYTIKKVQHSPISINEENRNSFSSTMQVQMIDQIDQEAVLLLKQEQYGQMNNPEVHLPQNSDFKRSNSPQCDSYQTNTYKDGYVTKTELNEAVKTAIRELLQQDQDAPHKLYQKASLQERVETTPGVEQKQIKQEQELETQEINQYFEKPEHLKPISEVNKEIINSYDNQIAREQNAQFKTNEKLEAIKENEKIQTQIQPEKHSTRKHKKIISDKPIQVIQQTQKQLEQWQDTYEQNEQHVQDTYPSIEPENQQNTYNNQEQIDDQPQIELIEQKVIANENKQILQQTDQSSPDHIVEIINIIGTNHIQQQVEDLVQNEEQGEEETDQQEDIQINLEHIPINEMQGDILLTNELSTEEQMDDERPRNRSSQRSDISMQNSAQEQLKNSKEPEEEFNQDLQYNEAEQQQQLETQQEKQQLDTQDQNLPQQQLLQESKPCVDLDDDYAAFQEEKIQLSDADKRNLDKLATMSQDDILQQAVVQAARDEQLKNGNENNKAMSNIIDMNVKQYQNIGSRTISDFQKAANSDGNEFWVPGAPISRQDYMVFVNQFIDFLKDPVGYETPFSTMFTKQNILLADYIIEQLQLKSITLFSKQGKKVLNSFEDIEDQNEMADLIQVQVRNGTFDQVKYYMETFYNQLVNKQSLETATLQVIQKLDKQLKPSVDDQLQTCSDIAGLVMDQLISEIAVELIKNK